MKDKQLSETHALINFKHQIRACSLLVTTLIRLQSGVLQRVVTELLLSSPQKLIREYIKP
jgi:hypothetical protein